MWRKLSFFIGTFFLFYFLFFFLQRKMQGSFMSKYDMQMMEVEYMQLAEQKHAK